MQLGLPVPENLPPPAPAAAGAMAPAMSFGGVLPAMSLEATLKAEAKQQSDAFAAEQNQPHISALAGYIKKCFRQAEDARRSSGQDEALVECMLARRGQYTAEKRQQIVESEQPEIYMMLAAAKMRQIEALLRDVLMGAGTEKPWTLQPTPVPELPPEMVEQVVTALQGEIQQALNMGIYPTMDEVRQRMRVYREQLDGRLREEAVIRCQRMENKMEDQLAEGDFHEALDQFITDLATFRTAFIKGPVIRKKPKLSWGPGGQMLVSDAFVKEWERVDPFNMFPAPHAKSVQDAWLIEKVFYTREALSGLIGVEGYSETALREVLDRYGDSGLYTPLSFDMQKAQAEGKDRDEKRDSGLIEGFLYWGTASGKMLQDWGMKRAQAPDAAKEYHVEALLIGDIVVRAVLNADPLARRPYRGCSFQRNPGSVWGSSPYDLMRDCQDMCNGAARALAANMGISSGPQVAVLVDRLPQGEEITSMHPWKLWQFQSDAMGGSAKPIEFFQPSSNANELMGVYEKFSLMADEYTGIPRYMAGFNGGEGGAGRTASGISMMIGNASKTIKQVLSAIDTDVITPTIESLYYYNMRYEDDPDLKGDPIIVARGAMSLTTKETAQVRTNEFLAATANPIDMQIIGMEGRAELLRHSVKRLDVSPDKVVPPVQVIKERAVAQQMAAMQQGMPPGPPGQGGPPGQKPEQGGQRLQNDAPVTDNFEPQGA